MGNGITTMIAFFNTFFESEFLPTSICHFFKFLPKQMIMKYRYSILHWKY